MATVAAGLDERRWPWPRVALAWPARLRGVSGIVALDAVVIGGLMVVALLSRLLALRWGAGLNSDEAVPGLMAMHVAAGTDWPVFYWGQHYFGSLEAYVLGALFKGFGFHRWLLFVPPTVASVALVPLTAAVARRLVSAGIGGGGGADAASEHRLSVKAAGWLAALPVAASTPVMSRMLAHAGGGFALAFALQGVALYCHLRALEHGGSHKGRLRWAALFGLSSGFLCWVWQPAIAVVAVLLVVLAARRRELVRAAVLPMVVGLLPPLIYNVTQGWPTLAEVLRKSQTAPDQAPAAIARSRWVVAILLGMAFGGGEDTFSVGTNWAQAWAVGLGVVVCLVAGVATRRVSRLVAGTLGLAFVANVVAAHGAVRHLLPAALIGFAFLGALPVVVFGTGARRRVPRSVVGAGLAALVVVPNLWVLPRAEGVYSERPAFGAAVEEVMAGLRARGLTHGYADYWTAYPITYWSGKRIVVSPVATMTYGGRFERYPDYTEEVHRRPSFAGLFLLLDATCDTAVYGEHIREMGGRYRLDRLGPYVLFWDVWVPPAAEVEALEVWRWRIVTEERC